MLRAGAGRYVTNVYIVRVHLLIVFIAGRAAVGGGGGERGIGVGEGGWGEGSGVVGIVGI